MMEDWNGKYIDFNENQLLLIYWIEIWNRLKMDFYCRKLSSDQSIASVHGAVLALAASVLSVPYDMPRYGGCF